MMNKLDRTQVRGFRAFLGDRTGSVLTIRGTSMYPVFCEGQKVLLTPISPHNAVVGRAYGYVVAGSITLHRLARKSGPNGFFVGDNALCIEKQPLATIIGEVKPSREEMSRKALEKIDYLLLPFLIRSRLMLRLRRSILHSAAELFQGEHYEEEI